jgi:hypothetical protein
MKPTIARWKLLLVLGLVVTAAITWMIPRCRYPIRGFLRGEPFYKGMPACYWRARIVQFEAYQDAKLSKFEALAPSNGVLSSLRDFLEDSLSTFMGGSEPEIPHLDDPAAIPVLITLLLDDDENVAGRAGDAIMVIREPALPALIQLLHNTSPKARICAIENLWYLVECQGAKTTLVPQLRELTRDKDERIAAEAKYMLDYFERPELWRKGLVPFPDQPPEQRSSPVHRHLY